MTRASKEAALSFGVSGFLWNDDLVMYDAESDSLWSQVAATTVRGPLSGTELELVQVGMAGLGGREREVADDRLPPKVEVLGVARDDTATAYPRLVVERERVLNDRVGDVPVVVAVTPGGSRWRVATGVALSGPHAGTTLDRANDRAAMFWFAWAGFHPETTVYGDPR